jgi:hypothetical protein
MREYFFLISMNIRPKRERINVMEIYSIRYCKWMAILVTFVSIYLAGCAGTIVHEDLPTIAHVHIGHALTGWKHTPDQKGLFVVAENMGEKALKETLADQQDGAALVDIKKHIESMLLAINPNSISEGKTEEFGLEIALNEAVNHITFAAESDDASQNVIDFAKQFEKDSEIVLNRCQLIVAVGKEILASDSIIEIQAFTEELAILNKINVYGSLSLNELGLDQLRTKLDEMISREEPPYEPVATRYLFGIIRLPSGKWAFSWLVGPWETTEGGGNDGSGGY